MVSVTDVYRHLSQFVTHLQYNYIEIKLSFENATYLVSEEDGNLETLIRIIKEDDVESEQTLRAVLERSQRTGFGAAREGMSIH